MNQFLELEKRLDKFSNIEHIDELKNKLMPKIQHFSTLIDDFMKDNETMRECIRRFDEDLTLKANKGEILTMQTFLET